MNLNAFLPFYNGCAFSFKLGASECAYSGGLEQYDIYCTQNLSVVFSSLQFGISQCFFIVYRASIAVYVLAWNIALHATWRENAAHSSFYYLSHWIYLLLAIYLIYAFIMTLAYAAQPADKRTDSPRSSAAPPIAVRRRTRRHRKTESAEPANQERRTLGKSHKIRKHKEHIRLRVRHSKNYDTRSIKTEESDHLLPQNDEQRPRVKRTFSGSLLFLNQMAARSKRARRAARRKEREERGEEEAAAKVDGGQQPRKPRHNTKAKESKAKAESAPPPKPIGQTKGAGASGQTQKEERKDDPALKKKPSPRANGTAAASLTSPSTAPATADKATQTRRRDMRLTQPRAGPPLALKVFWVFHSTACNLSIVITLMVYLVMYPYLGALSALIKVDAITLNCHGLNSIIVLIDLVLSSVPVRLFHCVYPAALGVLYVIFSLVYWSLDKYFNVLYIGILDWNDPGTASGISALLILVVVPLIQLFLFGISLLRDAIHDCCSRKVESSSEADDNVV
jgi:hypothetical protein